MKNMDPIRKIFEDPERGYARAIVGLIRDGLYDPENSYKDDKVPPTRGEALEVLIQGFTSSQLEVLNDKRIFSQAKFVLEPVIPISRAAAALNSRKPVSGQSDIYISSGIKDVLDQTDQVKEITSWRLGIGEGAKVPNILPGDWDGGTLNQRAGRFTMSFADMGVLPMGYGPYFRIMQDSLMAGDPIDDVCNLALADNQRTWTMLADIPTSHRNKIVGGFWANEGKQIVLDEYENYRPDQSARVRAWMPVEV